MHIPVQIVLSLVMCMEAVLEAAGTLCHSDVCLASTHAKSLMQKAACSYRVMLTSRKSRRNGYPRLLLRRRRSSLLSQAFRGCATAGIPARSRAPSSLQQRSFLTVRSRPLNWAEPAHEQEMRPVTTLLSEFSAASLLHSALHSMCASTLTNRAPQLVTPRQNVSCIVCCSFKHRVSGQVDGRMGLLHGTGQVEGRVLTVRAALPADESH